MHLKSKKKTNNKRTYGHDSFTFPQLRAQNQVLKKAVVDEQANSATLKVKCKKE